MTGEPRLGTTLEAVIIFTPHMEALAAFYRRALDLGPYERSPGHMGQPVGPVYFGFDHVDDAETTGSSGVTLWFTVEDLDATFKRVVAMGAGVRYPPTQKPWGARLASVLDPDGNILGLAQRKGSGSGAG